MINLYSDTQTLPTAQMQRAMVEAELGDDVLGADPTVNRLEEESAALFGKEAALLVPSGTMANLVSLIARRGHGDEIFVDPGAHVYYYESGGLCSLAGYVPSFLRAERGRPDPQSLVEKIRPPNVHFARPGLLWLENTHNSGGGTVLPAETQRQIIAIAREHDLEVHLDGARIFNASVATGRPVAELVADVDTVSFCLSKGLSCPIGSLLVGPRPFIDRARRARKRLGGGMRQAGIVAACGLVALQTMVDRLAEDHRNAAALARALESIEGIAVRPEEVETNMVFIDVSALGNAADVGRVLERNGVLASPMSAAMLRLVTHRHFDAESVPAVAEAFRKTAAELR